VRDTFPQKWREENEGNEAAAVRQWRLDQARRAGLGSREAARFADGVEDIEQMRKAASRGAPPELLAAIFT